LGNKKARVFFSLLLIFSLINDLGVRLDVHFSRGVPYINEQELKYLPLTNTLAYSVSTSVTTKKVLLEQSLAWA
jgi:hypothetical protein